MCITDCNFSQLICWLRKYRTLPTEYSVPCQILIIMVAKLKQSDNFCMVVTSWFVYVASHGGFSSSCSQIHFKSVKLQFATIQWHYELCVQYSSAKWENSVNWDPEKQPRQKNSIQVFFIATRTFNRPYVNNADSEKIKESTWIFSAYQSSIWPVSYKLKWYNVCLSLCLLFLPLFWCDGLLFKSVDLFQLLG